MAVTVYTKDNCVSCCGICNKAKGSMTYDQFSEWLTLIGHRYKGLSYES